MQAMGPKLGVMAFFLQFSKQRQICLTNRVSWAFGCDSPAVEDHMDQWTASLEFFDQSLSFHPILKTDLHFCFGRHFMKIQKIQGYWGLFYSDDVFFRNFRGQKLLGLFQVRFRS